MLHYCLPNKLLLSQKKKLSHNKCATCPCDICCVYNSGHGFQTSYKNFKHLLVTKFDNLEILNYLVIESKFHQFHQLSLISFFIKFCPKVHIPPHQVTDFYLSDFILFFFLFIFILPHFDKQVKPSCISNYKWSNSLMQQK